jgi:hypothetical protein
MYESAIFKFCIRSRRYFLLSDIKINCQAQLNVPLPPSTTTTATEGPETSGRANASDEFLNLYRARKVKAAPHKIA